MTSLRTLAFARRWSALAFVVLALAVRLVVPAGMMPGIGPHGASLVVCSGQISPDATTMPGMAMPAGDAAMVKVAPHTSADHFGAAGKSAPAKPDAPCAFTGLLAAALDGAALPALLAQRSSIAVLAAAGLIVVAGRTLRLRPPPRGPPTLRIA